MKKILKTTAIALMSIFMFNCSNDDKNDDTNTGGGAIPSTGWRIGTTNYTTFFTMKNAGQPNSIAAFDAIPGSANLNTVAILFNNTTGIAAGTYKVVTKPDQEDLLSNEIMVSMSTGYSLTTDKYTTDYVTALDKSVNATVTITGGKVKVVVPEIEIVSLPISSGSAKSTFAGTIIEK